MNHPIAIIGMAGRFPEAGNISAFRQNLREGRCSIRPISKQRLSATTLANDREYQVRGFIEDIHFFDHKYFGIPMGEAVHMDPHQRLLLEVVHDALADSGYGPDALNGTNTAVFVADKNLRYYEHADEYDPMLVTGNASEFMAARINRAFNFNGSTALIDTSCSSSLVALHNACNELALGDADQAIVCGANIELFPYKDIGYHIEVDSADGTSIPFSDRSNGMVYGEAVIAFLLKPLEAALRDRDPVHAVIRATTVNNNAARSASLTAPDAYGQAEVLLRTWKKAGVKSSDIGFIEAHGSGTQLGDSLEVGGLNEAIRVSDGDAPRIPISTVKANIGHCRTVAGLAGLMKAVCSVKYGEHYPAVYTGVPSPLIRFDQASVYINETLRPWHEQGRTRLAGVSSIGFSGTNCHVLLEEAPPRPATQTTGADQLLLLSSWHAEGFKANLNELAEYLDAHPATTIEDLAFTLGTGRRAGRYRKALRVRNVTDALAQVQALLQEVHPEPLPDTSAKLFLVFSDGNALTPAIIDDYRQHLPAFDAVYSEVLLELQPVAAVASPKLHAFAFQYAMHRYLESAGITSQQLLGAGSGRLLTRVISGNLTVAEALPLFLQAGEEPSQYLDQKINAFLAREPGKKLFLDLSLGCDLTGRLQTLEGQEGIAVFGNDSPCSGFLVDLGAFLFEHHHSIDPKFFRHGQRINLPAPQFARTSCWIRTSPKTEAAPAATAAPVSGDSVEQAVHAAWCSVLKRKSIDPGEQFFEAGGDSLAASAVIQRLGETLGIQLDFEDLFDYPVYEDFLNFLRSRMPLREQLLLIWKEVLRSDELRASDNFFELGGHSLLANQILNRVRLRLGATLDFEDFFKHPTIEEQALLIAERTGKATRPAAIERLAVAESYAASQAQRRLWILSHLEKESLAYNEFNIARLRGTLDAAALATALDAIVDRHESFRTVFYQDASGLRQSVRERTAAHQLRFVDLRDNPDPHAETLALAHRMKQTPFDMEQGPLFAMTLVQLGPDDFAFLMAIHHIIFDEWSFGVFQRELAQRYAAITEGRHLELSPLRIQYRDYSAWMNRRVGSEEADGLAAYWMQLFAQLPAPSELPLDHPRPAVQRHKGRLLTHTLAPLHKKVLTARPGISGFMSAIATVSLLLHKYSGAETIVIGSPVAGRDHWELEDQIGFYVNTVALRTDIDSHSSYEELLEQVRDRVIGAYEHQLYPFDLLVEQLDVARDRSRHPLFDVMVLFRKVDPSVTDAIKMGSVQILPFADTTTTSKFDLSFEFIENGEDVQMNITYNAEIFEENSIAQLALNYSDLLAALARHPRLPIESLSLLNEEAEAFMLHRFGKGGEAFAPATLPELFSGMAQQEAGRIALRSRTETLTYSELAIRVDAVAAFLQDQGLNPGDAVALLLDRRPATIVAQLAVLRAGGIYVPVGTSELPARVLHMIRSSGATFVLTTGALLYQHPELSEASVRILTDLPEQAKEGRQFAAGSPDATACILYTSGSTGTSKGVALKHLGLANTVRLLHDRFGTGPGSLLLHRISYVFDFSLLEVFGALCNGASLYVASEDELDTLRIAKLLRDQPFTGACFTPTELQQLLDVVELQTGRLSPELKWIIAGGEELTSVLAAQHYRLTSASLINIYGPTEASIFVACQEIHQGAQLITLGAPVPGMHLMVLDDRQRPVPVGFPGRLYLSGCGLAKGYVPIDDKNNIKFDQYINEKGEQEVRYDTGDLCRWLPDGTLKFLGRADHQIKINGFRIEPGEVECALLEYEAVEAAAVVCVTGKAVKELVGFVVAKPPVSGLPAMLPAARTADEHERQQLREWNQTENAFIPASILEQLQHWAATRPAAIAVVCDDQTLSYLELHESVESLAAQLQAEGIAPGAIVPVFCARSSGLLIAFLAVLRCGAAYLPLSPEWPVERMREIVSDCGARRVIGDEASSVLAAPEVRILLLSELLQRPAPSPAKPVHSRFEDAAYIIYTSGSTGRPKGVVIHHGGMMNHLQSKVEVLNLTTESRIIQNAPQAFDISIWQFLAGILCGGTTLIYPDPLVRSLQAFARQVVLDRATILELVPSYLSELVELPEVLEWKLDHLLVTGETLRPRLAERWLERRPDITLVNAYGPTEASDDIAHFLLRAGEPVGQTIPVGRAVRNMRLYVLNEALEPCGLGEQGEIYTSGIGVGLGYLNDEKKTQAAFLDDPFVPGARMYRTGDYGRFRQDGNLEFIGRMDAQVKVRGNRIELGEVEQGLMKLPFVQDAVVLCHRDENGQPALVAYLTGSPAAASLRNDAGRVLPAYMVPASFQLLDAFPLTANGKIDKGALTNPFEPGEALEKLLRSHLARRLPDYMIPSRIAVLPKLPLTVTGKVDRLKLAALAREHAVEETFVAPVSETQRLLCNIWAEVLGRESIGIHDDFFAIGGNSLKGMRLIAEMERAFGQTIDFYEIFIHVTVEQQARLFTIDRPASASGIPVSSGRVRFPASHAQRRLFVLSQLETVASAYNITGGLSIRGRLDQEQWRRSWTELIERHPILRTVFEVEEGEPVQVILPAAAFEHDLVVRAAKAPDAVEAIWNEQHTAPFAMVGGHLFRATMVCLGKEEFIFLYTLHHTLVDEWSFGVLGGELLRLYDAAVTGQPSGLPPLDIHYGDFALWQATQLSEARHEESRQYWKQRFNNLPSVLELPYDRPRPPVKTYAGKVSRRLAKGIMPAMQRLSERHGTSLFMNVHAVLQVLLYKYTGQTDLVVGTPIAGRDMEQLRGQVGLYQNTLALRTQLQPKENFERVLRSVRENLVADFEHQHYPFDLVVEDAGVSRDLSRSPLFDVMIVLHDSDMGLPAGSVAGLGFKEYSQPVSGSKFDLSFHFLEKGEDLLLSVNYNTDLFDEAHIDLLLEHLEVLLERLPASAGTPVAEVDCISSAERKRLLETFSGHTPPPAHETIEGWLQAGLQKDGEDAVVCGDRRISRKALLEQSGRLANCLRERYGVGRGSTVAVLLPPSVELAVAILGIVRAGGAYLPLDPQFPESRLRHMIDDSKTSLSITAMPDARFARSLVWDLAFQQELANYPAEVHSEAKPDDIAYVIYTSGSTGLPKGVPISQSSLCHYVNGFASAHLNHGNYRGLLVSSIAFDLGYTAFWTMLLGFGTVCFSPDTSGFWDASVIWRTIEREKINMIKLTPSHLKLLLDALPPARSVSGPSLIVTGGEAADGEAIARWLEWDPGVRFVNHYGPTETTIGVLTQGIVKESDSSTDLSLEAFSKRPVLGCPLGTHFIRILDAGLRLQPIGVPGEICIGGPGLSPGYLNQAELSASRFIEDPSQPGVRIYRSGDKGRWTADGRIEFGGRIDQQIKLAGYRIEPGEVIAALRRLPGILDAAVDVREIGSGRQLIAYVVGPTEVDEHACRFNLETWLSPYMVPARIVAVEALPLTSNGKIDTARLPDPDLSIGRPAREAASLQEELLLQACRTVLARPEVTLADDFFRLGGDSIRALQIVSYLYRNDFALAVKDLFTYPVLEALALRMKPLSQPLDQRPVTGWLPLLPIQMEFFERGLRHPHHYNQSVLLRASAPLSIPVLQKTIALLQTHHDALRLIFPESGSGRQFNQDENFLSLLEVFDLQQEPGRYEQELQALQRSFNLSSGPLFKTALFRMPEGDRLLMTAHHLLVDGVSWRILLEDFYSVYKALARNEQPALPPKTASLKAWSEGVRNYANTWSFVQQHGYWLEPSRFKFPVIAPEAVAGMQGRGHLSFELHEEATSLLLTGANGAFHTEINDLLVAALTNALGIVFGIDRVALMFEGHGREELLPDVPIHRTVGWFTSLYPVALPTGAEEDWSAHIKATKETLREIPFKGIGYGLLRYRDDVPKGPLPEAGMVLFNYLGQFNAEASENEFDVSMDAGDVSDPDEVPRFGLSVTGMTAAARLGVQLEFDRSRYTQATMAALARQYRFSLEELIRFCGTRETSELTPADLSYRNLSLQDLENIFE